MSTPETSLSVTGGDAPAATDTSTGLAPIDSASAIPSGGIGDLQTTAGQAEVTEAPAWEGIIDKIPDNDDDLAQPTFPHVEGLKEQRQQLRVLKAAIKELQASQSLLPAYQELGDVDAIKPAIELQNLLYSPMIDPRTQQPIIDQATGTSYVTTKPFVEYLDAESPGMPEQLLVDLLDFQPTDENGMRGEKLSKQVLRHWGLDPARIDQYRNIDKLVATSSGAVTAEELKDILPEFHDAYRNLPPSIRDAWPVYSEADQMVMLRREKDALDRVVKDKEREERDREREAAEIQQYRALVAQEQDKYIDTVRHERFASIADQLSKQVTFSTDAATNAVMHGAVGTVLWNLIDPPGRFVSEGLLTALGVKLDHTFDEALNAFNANAAEYVAQAMQGDSVRASSAQTKANSAANLLTTKLGTIALKVAKAMGGQQQAAATQQGQALGAAATSRPTAGNGTSPNGQPQGILPPHIRPGTPEAARWLAESTGFWRTT